MFYLKGTVYNKISYIFCVASKISTAPPSTSPDVQVLSVNIYFFNEKKIPTCNSFSIAEFT